MTEEILTFSTLAENFDMNVEEVHELAEQCGIKTYPHDRLLTTEERDKLYDAWLYSNINNVSNINRKTSKIRKKIILIDTSSLLQSGSEKFLKKSARKLSKGDRQIIVPLVVMHELNKKAIQNQDKSLSQKARNIINIILEYRDMGALEIYGDDTDGTFADNVFHKVAAMFALNYDFIVITQDYGLAQDLLTMAHMKSVSHRKISVYKINSNGNLLIVKYNKKGA